MPRRARVTAEPTYSLGWELEATQGARNTPIGVIREHDGSVAGQGLEYKIGADYVSRIPENLEALRALTADTDLHVDRSCGFHVHIGLAGRATPLQRQQWAGNFVLLARAVEDTAFQSVPESRRENSYCRRWQGATTAISAHRYHSSKYGNAPFRYQWVNVVEMFRPGGIGTVEIRLLGSTKRYAYLLAWIAACHAMARASWRMIADPTLLESESIRLNAMFENLRDSLLRPSNNETAYHVAGTLASAHGLPIQDISRLINLADRTENVRSERVRSARAAHALALEIEIRFCHAEALVLNNLQGIDAADERIRESLRRRAGQRERNNAETERLDERDRAERVRTRNFEQAQRDRAERLLAESERLAAHVPVVPVLSLAGFNPDQFTITNQRSQ